jgi:multiple sugar transport system substrate-binding protein
MKKIIALVLVATLLCFASLSLTSCNKSYEFTDFVMPEGGYDGSPVTITFMHTMGEKLATVLDYYLEDFKKMYPNITVEHSSGGGYDDVRSKISKQITVGNQPNVAYCYPDHVAAYNVAGAVVDLNVFIESVIATKDALGNEGILGFTDADIANFIEGYYAEGTMFGDLNGDGKNEMYTLPYSKSTEVLYYNVEAFEKWELAVPTTWDEMKETCRILKEKDPTCIPLGYDSEANWFITMCEQYQSPYTSATGDNFLFDNETNRNFVKKFREWYEKKWVTTQELSGGYTSSLFTGTSSSSSSSSVPTGTRCYMCIGSTGGATYQRPNYTNGQYEFEVGITSMPQVNPEEPKVISQGPSVCIFKKDNPQEVIATWLFAKFLTTNVDFQARMSMNNGYAPVIKSVTENEIYADFLASASTANIQAYAVKVALAQEKAYYSSPAFNGSSVAREQVGLLIQKCLSGDAGGDVDAMIKKAFEDCVAECKYQSGQ